MFKNDIILCYCLPKFETKKFNDFLFFDDDSLIFWNLIKHNNNLFNQVF